MRIFVAGAAGAIGRLMVPALVRAGHDVVGMTRSPGHVDTIRQLGAQPVVADVFDREQLETEVLKARPDCVIHQLTSLGNRDFAANSRIRIEGTRNLVDAALKAGTRKMIAQSIAWAYEPGPSPATEEVPLDLDAPLPRQGTIQGVAALEEEVSRMPEPVILRYGKFYGPGTWFEQNEWMAEQVRLGQIPAQDGITSFVHVEDAARAAVLALDWPPGTVNIVDDEPASSREWLPVYADLLGAPAPTYEPGSARGERGALNTKARLHYGWQPIYPSWRSGFAESLK
ncbi:NAD(P)-dependent oxidoreductase [Paenibacillus sp. J22TS3]|uniref:NAD-dependent epimerase/dehydratase family protein n=1 Tax=Paenibacillus sp. J22TS3 TaxID=2807192 RepID=UPI001BCAB838|nr:NAD(P)-dependent oxidoreductase [Paenibacillus sp. J22TS3]